MFKLACVSIFFMIITHGVYSQEIDNENFIVSHGPYLQNLSSTGVTIVWTTNKPSIPGVTISYPDGSTKLIRNSHDGLVDGGGMLHKVRIEGLDPGNKYKYNIVSVQILKYQAYKVYYGDTLRRKEESFITPFSGSDNVSFCVINDVHENSGKLASYIKNGNGTNKDLYFFNGDMVDYLQSGNQLFPGFIDTAVSYFASRKPFYYVRGNHEARGYFARELKDYFDFIDDRFYYSFNNGPVRFIVLDCGEDKPDNNRNYYGLADFDSYRSEELEWLKDEVQSDAYRNAKRRIVIIHMPILKGNNMNHTMTFLAENFGPVLQTADVDLMISAHIHQNVFYEADKSGFGYPLLVNSNNSFVEVIADPNGIKAVVKDVDGSVINSYTIK